MLLRLILLFSLIAAITTVLAAPPRFVIAEPAAPPTLPALATAPATQANTPDSSPETTTSAPATTVAEPQTITPTTPAVANPNGMQTAMASEPKEEKRGFFWFFNRKKAEPEAPPQNKPENALVPTDDHYHKTDNEKLDAADLTEYRSGYQSYWQGESSKVLCSLAQRIPNYGYVEFRQGLGQPLEFAMFVNQPPAGVGRAHVRIQPPYWRHYSKEKDLGYIELESGKRAVTMQTNWSNRLIMELREGMQPVIRYWDVADATTDIEIMLSSLNFQEGLSQFENCLAQIPTYNVQQASRVVVHFQADSSKLRKQASEQLDELLEILKVDSGIKQVDIELYSTKEGLAQYSFRLSTRRARAIRDYMMKRGIEEDKLLIKIHTKSEKEFKKQGFNPTDIHILLKREKDK